MPGAKLRRCAVCKKFHASYLVPDFEHGKGYLCYSCWKARLAAQESPASAASAEASPAPGESEPSSSSDERAQVLL